MRFNSTAFTHSSTAMFGAAVVGYAALRLMSYAAPHLPHHDPAPAQGSQHVRSIPGTGGRGVRIVEVPKHVIRRHQPSAATTSTARLAASLADVAVSPGVAPMLKSPWHLWQLPHEEDGTTDRTDRPRQRYREMDFEGSDGDGRTHDGEGREAEQHGRQ